MNLSRWDRSVLAQAYGLSTAEVIEDAQQIACWRGPMDDLLFDLSKRHGWTAGGGYSYLRSVRRALLGQQPR